MRRTKHRPKLVALSLVIGSLTGIGALGSIRVRSPAAPKTIKTADLRAEVTDFLSKELAAHFAEIKTLDPPPERVVGAPTTGEFSWGTFMYALARFANTTEQRELTGRDLAKWVGQIGL